ncbi:mitochondrial 54S ribosomal protein mrpl1 [Ceratobasidium sp. 392]|nr:mitochondrial 54S ribosomal protein mrpl1 [Ceratobasidium sp. 392]
MAYTPRQRTNNGWSDNDDFEYPEPNYPYLYASSVGHTTPAVSSAPLPPPSVAPSNRSSTYPGSRGGRGGRMPPERAYSDASRTSGDSYITPSVSISQVGNRPRAPTRATLPRSRATSFVSRDDPSHLPPRQSTAYTSTSRPPTVVASPPRSQSVFTAGSSRTGPMMRRLRGVLKKPRPPTDNVSYTSASSAPEIIQDSPRAMESPLPVPPSVIESDNVTSNRRSMAPSSIVQKTRFHGNSIHVSRHLSKSWDARSPPLLDSAARAAPAFDIAGVRSIQLIVSGLPWSIHVRAGSSGRSRSRSRTRVDQITVGDVVDSVYASLNKSLTRTDVRAASNETKKRIARAAAAAEAESQRGEHSARMGKPSAARRIDFLGSRCWFQGLEKNDRFAREEGYGLSEGELKNGLCRVGLAQPGVIRLFSSTSVALAKISSPGKKKRRRTARVREINGEAMPITEAATVLRAIEVDSPISAYELHIKTQFTRGQAPLRGRIALPRDPRTRAETVLVFADGKAAQDAKDAGAAHVGGEDLIPAVLDGTIKPTKGQKACLRLPPRSSSPKTSRLMPAAKRGTVTEEVTEAVREAKGMLDWKGDKLGYVRAAVGRIHFPAEEVEKNIRTFLQAVRDTMKPEDEAFATRQKATSTILQVYLSSTQGPGIELSDVGYTPYK